MALNAKTHLKLCRQYQPIHMSNVPMALAAIKACLNVNLMTKEYKIRQIRNPYPFNRDALVVVLAKFDNLRVMDNDLAVAKNARLKRRYAGLVGVYRSGMTHETAKLLFGYVDTMAEWNRLLRCSAYRADRIKYEK
jgi:hypothetical protein